MNDTLRAKLTSLLSDKIVQHQLLEDAFVHIEPLILHAFGAQHLSIFQRRTGHNDLVSRFRTKDEVREVIVGINPHSIVGYVAMAQQPVFINDPYNPDAIKKIHKKLRFEQKYDRLRSLPTENMLCVPILFDGILLGVIEIMNKQLRQFDDDDVQLALDVASMLAASYRYEIGGTKRPFDFLEFSSGLSREVIASIPISTSIEVAAEDLNTEHGVSFPAIYQSLAVYFQMPFIDYLPEEYQAPKRRLKLSKSYLMRNNVVLLKDSMGGLLVVMFQPSNVSLLMEIEKALGTEPYQLAVSLPKIIHRYLEIKEQITSMSRIEKIIDDMDDQSKNSTIEQVEIDDESGVIQLVANILLEAKRLKASDIHIDPEYQQSTLVRMRVDGVVRDISKIPGNFHNAVVARIKIMADLDISEKRMPQDGKLIFEADNQKLEVRIATIPTVTGEGIVLRVLAGSNVMPINKINLALPNLSRLENMVQMPHGILLVVGPTGSGKTTTLHAILGFINTPDRKIWTAEDPVEITQYRLQQVQVNPKIGFTFAKALRAFLRADPDVILIGEMRDKETANAAVEASLTGHLVLSTLHTNSAPETITRLLDLGIDPVNFSDACVGILAQRLIRTLCSNCKEQYVPSSAEFDFIYRHYGDEFKKELSLAKDDQLYRPRGCADCSGTGYKGRTGVHELLSMTPALRSLIYHNAPSEQLTKQAMKDGMRTLAQDAIVKVIDGQADIAQIQILSGAGITDE